MNTLLYIIQMLVALGLLNVWLLRFKSTTAYRGGDAKTLREEFAVYGLPVWFYYLIGTLKVGSATALLMGFIYPELILPAASLIVALMLGAVAMHFKVRDPLKKALPASAMLGLSVFICLGAL